MKSMILGLILGFLFAGACGAEVGISTAGHSLLENSEIQPPPQFLVYYFHNHIRCDACRSMESMAADVVDYDFIPQVNKGLLEMRTVDVQDEGQEHFVKEFDLDGPTLILVEQDPGGKIMRWQNLDRIWDLVNQPEVYEAYVRQGITAFMENKKP